LFSVSVLGLFVLFFFQGTELAAGKVPSVKTQKKKRNPLEAADCNFALDLQQTTFHLRCLNILDVFPVPLGTLISTFSSIVGKYLEGVSHLLTFLRF